MNKGFQIILAGVCFFVGGIAYGAPERFSVQAEPDSPKGMAVFRIQAAEPGNYRVVVNAAAETVLPDGAEIVIHQNGVRKIRPVIPAGAKSGRVDAVRMVLGKDTEILKVESPAAAVSRIDLVPMKVPQVPQDAVDYVPAVLPAGHPRVLISPAVLPEIRSRLTVGENGKAWQAVSALATAPLPPFPPKDVELRYNEQLLQALRAKAFFRLMTGEDRIGREAIEALCRYLGRVDFGVAQDISREIGESIFTASLVYDYCYDLLTDGEKAFLIERYRYFAGEMEIGYPPFLEPALYGHANEAQISRDLLSMAIAVFDEDPEPYRYCSYALMEVSAPAKNYLYRSGRHDQGTAYGNYRFAWDMHAQLLYMRMANHALFDPAPMYAVPYRWIYLRTPDGKLFKEGDDFFAGLYPGNPMVNFLTASLNHDPLLKAEYQKIDGHENIDPVFFLLVNDPALRPEDRRKELPLTAYYPSPMGGMVARTGWNSGISADDVAVSMIGAGYQYRNHHHLDAGSFQIYHRGLLLADLGLYRGYGNPFDWNFHKSSVSHTTLLIRDPEFPVPPSERRRYSANSGTQEAPSVYPPSSLKEQLENPIYRSGDIAAYGFGPDQRTPEYSFLDVDLTPSYGSRVTACRRLMLFWNLGVPGVPAAMVVYDRIARRAERIEPFFQLTSPVQPVRSGKELLFTNAPYGRSGQLAVTTLLPNQAKYEILSGKDCFTIDGKPYLPGAFRDFDNAGTRVLISAENSSERDRFLQIMQIRNGGAAPLKNSFREEDGRITLSLADRTVNFAAGLNDCADQLTLHIPEDAPRTLVLHLEPGQWHLCGRKGSAEVTVSREERGFFAVLQPGKYELRRVGAVMTPAPEKECLWWNDVKIEAVPEMRENQVWLPLCALLRAAGMEYHISGQTLTFENAGTSVTVTEKSSKIRLGDFAWECGGSVFRNAAGEWFVPENAAAALLNALVFQDAEHRNIFCKSIAPGAFWSLTISGGDPAAWRQLWRTTRGKWNAQGRDLQGEVVFRNMQTLTGLELLRGDGALRRSSFRIEGSADGEQFKVLFDGESSGKNAGWESVRFPAEKIRILRFYFRGNHENEQNGLLGIRQINFQTE